MNSPFDEATYKALLEGLEVSEVKFSKLREYIFGSNFNSTTKQKALDTIKSTHKVSDYFTFHSDIVKDLSNVTSYDLTHTLGNFLHEVDISEHIDKTRKLAKQGDFIISRLRSYLKEFAVVQKYKETQVFSTEYLVYRPKTTKISSHTLLAFCLTEQVQTILNCSQYGTEHPRFYEFVFDELPLPDCLFVLNEKINGLFDTAYKKRDHSQSLYRQAESLLLQEIGLQDFVPSSEKCNIKSFKESFLATGRLDAEYYQRKYEDIEKIIKIHPCETVENICTHINYGSVPTSPYTEDGEGIPYIKGMNLKNLKITGDLDRLINTDALPEKVFTKEDDIIISQMGTVGDVGIISKADVGYIFASFTIRIRIKDKSKYNPYYVGLYIQNVAKQWYLLRNIAQASVRQNTDLPTIKNMYIPFISIEIQQQIAALITESFRLREESERLLEQAKAAVEQEIERESECL